jgi:hypothetical protein
MNNREQHLNEATSIVIYSPINSRLSSVSNQHSPSTASCIATYTISGNASAPGSNGNDQEADSPLLSFCSVTNTLLNQ